MMELCAGTDAVLSAVKGAEDGRGIIVRLYNTASKKSAARLDFQLTPLSAECVDALENETGGRAQIIGNAVEITLDAYSVGAVRVCFQPKNEEKTTQS
jgi:alpha-mannosidase